MSQRMGDKVVEIAVFGSKTTKKLLTVGLVLSMILDIGLGGESGDAGKPKRWVC